MTTENEWVKLPIPNPATLPKGTRCRSLHGDAFRAETEIRISSCDESHYVGDWLAEPHGPTYHNDFFSREGMCVQLPPGYRFEGSEVVKEEAKSCSAVREQMSQAYTAQAYQQQIYAQQGGLGLSDYVFRQGDYQQTGIQYGDCPRPECARKSWNPMRDRCDHCGVTGKEIAAKRAKPACKCGSTSNLAKVGVSVANGRVSQAWRCGPCEQSRRRAELQAQKLEQTKRDMNRPVKRDPYEWLGFSSADWEE